MDINSTTKKEGFQLKNGDSIIISSKMGSGISKIMDSLDADLRRIVLTPDSVARASLGIDNNNGKSIRLDNNVCDMLLKSFFSARCEQGLSSIIIDPLCVTNDRRMDYQLLSRKTGGTLTFVELNNEPTESSIANDAEYFGLMVNEAKTINTSYESPNVNLDLLVTKEIEITHLTNEIQSSNIDIIGDIHGMYNELVNLIESMGYIITKDNVLHPEGRKLVFLGDYVDRGYDSLNTILLIKLAVEAGHYAIKGNHEEMLLQSITTDGNSDIIYTKSIASAGTVDKVLRMGEKERRELLSFISSLPSYLTHENYAFVHADIETFNPTLSIKNSLVFGDSIFGQKNSDEKYTENYNLGINKYKVIRGHSRSYLFNGIVTSLESGQAYGGELLGLTFDKFKELSESGVTPKECFHRSIKTVSCADYNYGDKIKGRVAFINHLKALAERNLIKRIDSFDNKFHMIDLSSYVYRNKLWEGDDELKSLRGMVFSVDGHVVTAGQQKMGEIGLTSKKLDKNEKVFFFDKPYGFNINIGRNPYGSGLIISTNSSFNSHYVEIAKDYMIKSGIYDKIDRLFIDQEITLNLSVSHYMDKRNPYCKTPMDNEIILTSGKYNQSLKSIEQGELGRIASLIGANRPDIHFMRFASIRDFVFSSENHSIAIYRSGKNLGECYQIPTLDGMTRGFLNSVKGVGSWDDFIKTGIFLSMNTMMKNSVRVFMSSLDVNKIKYYDESFISEKIKPVIKNEIISFMKESAIEDDYSHNL